MCVCVFTCSCFIHHCEFKLVDVFLCLLTCVYCNYVFDFLLCYLFCICLSASIYSCSFVCPYPVLLVCTSFLFQVVSLFLSALLYSVSSSDPTVGGRNPTPPKKSYNDDSPVNTNKQIWFLMPSKWCEMNFATIHSKSALLAREAPPFENPQPQTSGSSAWRKKNNTPAGLDPADPA